MQPDPNATDVFTHPARDITDQPSPYIALEVAAGHYVLAEAGPKLQEQLDRIEKKLDGLMKATYTVVVEDK